MEKLPNADTVASLFGSLIWLKTSFRNSREHEFGTHNPTMKGLLKIITSGNVRGLHGVLQFSVFLVFAQCVGTAKQKISKTVFCNYSLTVLTIERLYTEISYFRPHTFNTSIDSNIVNIMEWLPECRIFLSIHQYLTSTR